MLRPVSSRMTTLRRCVSVPSLFMMVDQSEAAQGGGWAGRRAGRQACGKHGLGEGAEASVPTLLRLGASSSEGGGLRPMEGAPESTTPTTSTMVPGGVSSRPSRLVNCSVTARIGRGGSARVFTFWG